MAIVFHRDIPAAFHCVHDLKDERIRHRLVGTLYEIHETLLRAALVRLQLLYYLPNRIFRRCGRGWLG